eukprot:scaffold95715_cov69-Phaeocystis_antarctica.AAC.3
MHGVCPPLPAGLPREPGRLAGPLQGADPPRGALHGGDARHGHDLHPLRHRRLAERRLLQRRRPVGARLRRGQGEAVSQ